MTLEAPSGVTQKRNSLGESVYASLSDGLIGGQLRPNGRLRIRELAERMGVSVTPVRDAILRLVQDEALVMRSARDIRVRTVSLSDYIEIRNIRLALEGLAGEEAARRAQDEDIRRLEQILDENEAALRDGRIPTAILLNQRFHFALAEIARMPRLTGVLKRIWLQMGPLIAISYEAGGRSMIDHHYPVLKAVRLGDWRMARQAIQDDILKGGVVIADQLQSQAAVAAATPRPRTPGLDRSGALPDGTASRAVPDPA